MKSFVVDVPENIRFISQLKYKLFIDGNSKNGVGAWSACILDVKEKEFIVCGMKKDDPLIEKDKECEDRMELVAIINGIKWILGEYDNETKPHVKITIHSDNVYAINIAREWISLWKNSNFENRPNADLLRELSPLLDLSQITFIWTSQQANDYMKKCRDLCFEMLTNQSSEIAH